jgi:HAD superfamily hydrolase (TIGR01509 family)
MISGAILDLGNTLVEIPEEFDEELCLQRLLGYPDMDSVRSCVYSLCGRYPGQSIEEFLERFDREVNPSSQKGISRAIRGIWQSSVDHAVLKEDALNLLDQFRSRHVALALVSNTPPTSHAIIDRLFLRSRFDEIVFSCDVGYLKPDPRIFTIALEKLKIKPEEALVIGDKIRTDILGGAILGMKAILVERRLRMSIENGQNYVDAIVCSLSDIFNTQIWNSLC